MAVFLPKSGNGYRRVCLSLFRTSQLAPLLLFPVAAPLHSHFKFICVHFSFAGTAASGVKRKSAKTPTPQGAALGQHHVALPHRHLSDSGEFSPCILAFHYLPAPEWDGMVI